MKRLILTRHAKSSWNHPGLDDHARPLNARGRKSAAAIGEWLRARSHVPDEIVSSSSQRTRETCALLGFDVAARFTSRLYHADPDQMLDVLQGCHGDTVLMLGHNPGIAWMAEMLVKAPPLHPRFHDYPTCATLVASLGIDDWHAAKFGSAQTLDFVIPRDLLE